MKVLPNLVCYLALCGLAAPAHADVRTAAFTGASDRSPTQTSMFVGATFRIGLNGKSSESRYRAGLGISGMTSNSGTSDFRIGQGLELSLDGARKPALRLAGADAGELLQTAKLNGGEKTALLVVGVVAALGVGALVAINSLPCMDGDDPCD